MWSLKLYTICIKQLITIPTLTNTTAPRISKSESKKKINIKVPVLERKKLFPLPHQIILHDNSL